MIGAAMADETFELQCPHCGEWLEIEVEPELVGTRVEECVFCDERCQLVVTRDEWGDPDVRIEKVP